MMKKRELLKLGFGSRELADLAARAAAAADRADERKPVVREKMKSLVANPESFFSDLHFGALARAVASHRTKKSATASTPLRTTKLEYRVWGRAGIEQATLDQMDNACRLPVAAAGALMPDAHVGYGLPIGGVLATRDCVIPYAVGVDIACRMRMTLFDLPVSVIDGQRDRLRKALERETSFGLGASFHNRRQHDVLDDDWSVSPITKHCKDKAWSQLGTSGSGNHFVEFGTIEVQQAVTAAGQSLAPGTYLALLSHSGSRGTGASVCSHYSKLAMQARPDLGKQLQHLAWLDLDSEAGHEYWSAMNLMGRYAAANHACIHRYIAKALGAEVVLAVENHHNFAWREQHGGESLIVHRKGATPAGAGVLGIIPGSMASPAFLVRGKGGPESLDSAAHGAGRLMSRTRANNSFTWSETKKLLKDRGVELISAGLDEAPMAYRDIDQVMAAQRDLVEPLGRFMPRIVKMAPAGERPED